MKPKTYLLKRIRGLEEELNVIIKDMETNRELVQAGNIDKVDMVEFNNKVTKVIGLKMAIAELNKVREAL